MLVATSVKERGELSLSPSHTHTQSCTRTHTHTHTPPLHPPMDRGDVVAIAADPLSPMACCAGPTHPQDYVVCVVFQGVPMHQLIARNNDGLLQVNTNITGCTTLDGLVAKLQTKQPFWPVPLREYVKNSGGSAPLATGDDGQGTFVFLPEWLDDRQMSALVAGNRLRCGQAVPMRMRSPPAPCLAPVRFPSCARPLVSSQFYF